jgi:hypothetical protein
MGKSDMNVHKDALHACSFPVNSRLNQLLLENSSILEVKSLMKIVEYSFLNTLYTHHAEYQLLKLLINLKS